MKRTGQRPFDASQSLSMPWQSMVLPNRPSRANQALAVAVLMLYSVALLPAAAGGNAGHTLGLALAEVLPDPAGGPEFIEIWNPGLTDADLTGWAIQDAAGSSYTFEAGWVLGPGARLVVWSGPGAADTPEGPAWRRGTVWNNAGDAATLTDPDGRVVDWVGYGTSRDDAPAGFRDATYPAAPPHGTSIAWRGDRWEEGSPTPGRAPESSGAATIRILNAEPVARFLNPPDRYSPGEAVVLEFMITDANGPSDLAFWTLDDGQGRRQEGSVAGVQQVEVVAPEAGIWNLELSAEDRAGSRTSTRLALLADVGLRILLPDGGSVAMPDLQPGGRNATALDPVGLQNLGQEVLVPRIDVSEFRHGPHRITTHDRLVLGVQGVGGDEEIRWYAYTGALTPLPPLAPGQEYRLWLRLAEVPEGLPAGSYATSFSVVA